MDSNLPFFSLPFVDSETPELEFNKLKTESSVYDVLNPSLPPNNALLGPDDVLAQFLSGDEPLEEPDLNGPTTLHCEICRKQFDNAKKYYGHLRVHSKENLWFCDKCPNLKFSTKQQMMKHSLIHKPLELIWKCPHCAMAFEALYKLQQHLFHKHLDHRPYKCDECEKAFYKPSDLKKHKEVHANSKKYPCKECDMRFNNSSNLRRHMLKHSDEKPFCCPGCRHRFKQLASQKRHVAKCPLNKFPHEPLDKTVRRHHCRVCGLSFQYKSALLEHSVRQHNTSSSEDKDDKYQNSDANRIVDNIVDDILSAEDDYMTMSAHNETLSVYYQTDQHPDHVMQIELLKDINQFQISDEELLYNDLDFDSIPPSHIFNTNTNDMDYAQDKNGEILFDFTDELLNTDVLNIPRANEIDNPVAECATIFESDVDLEASTNLAANLNQLIGENRVQYISTEHDDTFIISLNSEIDAEKLTDMLNIGVELVNKPGEEIALQENQENICRLLKQEPVEPVVDVKPLILTTEPPQIDSAVIQEVNKVVVTEQKPPRKIKPKVLKLFVCRKCNKVFSKKDTYKSHRGVHDASLRQHGCAVCGARFSYRSSLNKHARAAHTPAVLPAHACPLCHHTYSAAWRLQTHIARDHERVATHSCTQPGCSKRFYKKGDLVVHLRFHSGERPFKCEVCNRGYLHVSHLHRHMRSSACNKARATNSQNIGKSREVKKELKEV
ncbi:uncharacterized protein LOC142981422 [Anticarsia gemmatalis]|uniref:uncharacterized protein LOC142981422 n=1 Tax=Anticarsia gemmatalis TaxID=129554 RepID=UPI003F7772A6